MRLLAIVVMAASAIAFTGLRTAQGESPATTPHEEPPSSCPITKPSDPPFVPPVPLQASGATWIGSAKLWTFVPADGVWRALPHYTPEDSRYRQKVFWWSERFDWRTENPPDLTITGQRLDGASIPLSSDPNANAGWTNDRNHPFMVDGIFIPTLGCWKITGHYKNEELSYVVWVTK
jgi:hypothetical protein